MNEARKSVEVRNGPVVLIVRDGWGENPHAEHDAFNAVKLAETPVHDRMVREYPHTLLKTAGLDVGVPAGTTGNSEVGHQNIGAGRIVAQDSVRVTEAIASGEFFDNAVLCKALDAARSAGRRVHLLGIASDAGVHGRLTHLYACVELCKQRGLAGDDVCLHLFTDGRDRGPFTGERFIAEVEAQLSEIGVGRIRSVIGRYWALDRDHRWERVARAYRALTLQGDGGGGGGPRSYSSAVAAVRAYYESPAEPTMQGDEFVSAALIGADDRDVQESRIRKGDTVIFYNYRGDRPRELVRALMMPEFEGEVHASPESGRKGFDRGDFLGLQMVTMCEYQKQLSELVSVAYPKPARLVNISGEYFANLGLRQFRCAETEKYPHVTFFFNDYREEPFAGERRQIIQSPAVATYDLQPEMNAFLVADAVVERLLAQNCEDFILVNFANPDMVGHTGNLAAATEAVAVVDRCVGLIAEVALRRSGSLLVTADHGNAEQMFDPVTGSAHTAHTLYEVPAIVVGRSFRGREMRAGGRLADLLPTVLAMLGLAQPAEMTGESLLLD